ncbi:MAG: hypothetical protein CME06_03920 [Gemmatimonadetes bacterium]|nr:hypothetical protein [Gemmatimonadota bacterium]
MLPLIRRLVVPGALAFSVFAPAPASSPLVIHPAVDRQIAGGMEQLRLWVFLGDKGAAESDVDTAINRARSRLSARCLDRRARRARGLSRLVGRADIPVDGGYVRAIERLGARVRHRSRWLNAISVEIDSDRVESLALLPFVREVRPVANHRWHEAERSRRRAAAMPAGAIPPEHTRLHEAPLNGSQLDYGWALEQLGQMDMIGLHDLGYSGENVLVAVFDTGFYKSHEALEDLTLVAERDFVFGDGDTEDEPEDEPGAMSHGTSCWSIIGAWQPGMMIGGAFGADFALAKTEDIRSETRAEEDNWVAAIEWADSLGADVISSSLIYFEFDGGFQYDYEDLDGRTAVTTLAAVQAHRYGIVVCNAMGNEGPASRTLRTPADSDSTLSVGAVEPDDSIASFSSRGPAADGRTKPDVCARGTEVFAACWDSPDCYTPWFGGTSGATPFVAAAVALLLDAHPDWSPYEVIDALKSTASRAAAPDNDYGWGVIRALDAAVSGEGVGVASSTPSSAAAVHSLSVSPNPFNPRTRIDFWLQSPSSVSLTIHDVSGHLVATIAGGARVAGKHSVVWDGCDAEGGAVPSGRYTVVLETAGLRVTQAAVVLK